MGGTYTNWSSENAQATKTALESNPTEGELKTVFDSNEQSLRKISSENDNCLDSYLDNYAAGGALYQKYQAANDSYDLIISGLGEAIVTMDGAENDSSVNYHSGGGGYSYTPTSTSTTTTGTTTDTKTSEEVTMKDEIEQLPTEPMKPVEPTEPTKPVKPVEPTVPTDPTEPTKPDDPTIVVPPSDPTPETPTVDTNTPTDTVVTGGGYSRTGGYVSDTTDTTTTPTDTTSTNPLENNVVDEIIEGNNKTYKHIPKSTSVITKKATGGAGSSVIPIAAGVAAAAAAGIGAKAYIDRKKNNDNGEDEEDFESSDWDGENIDMIYDDSSDTKEETLLDDEYSNDVEEEPVEEVAEEKYVGRNNDELLDMQ